MFDQQIRPAIKRLEPQVDKLKLKANEVVSKGRVLSQGGLAKARSLQEKTVESFKNSSLSNKEAMMQMFKQKSISFSDFAIKKGTVALHKSENCNTSLPLIVPFPNYFSSYFWHIEKQFSSYESFITRSLPTAGFFAANHGNVAYGESVL